MKRLLLLALTITLPSLAMTVHGYGTEEVCEPASRFIFSWPSSDDCNGKPRGGTSQGGQVVFDHNPHPGWLELQADAISTKERDRRAILAMAGHYQVTFDFLEIMGYRDDFKRDRPYQSWGTEAVYVLANEPDFISLQHIMVMVFVDQDGKESEPMVMKHWRQDWRYQPKNQLVYHHNKQWRLEKISASERKGAWSQTVYQVDDSPRYASYGVWQHNSSFSTWVSQTTRRPLPRREHSVRNDYDVLEGFNRHTITRYGWVQEEENWKLVLNESGLPVANDPYISKEMGLARYRHIIDFDFSAGDNYMATAGQFWADVRAEFDRVINNNKGFSLHRPENAPPLFLPLFEYAADIVQKQTYDQAAGKKFVAHTIAQYSTP